MIYIEGKNGEYLKLEIRGYQFPDLSKIDSGDDYYDPNWLILWIEVNLNEMHWEKAEPCVMTHELIRTIDWLKAISQCEQTYNEEDYLEPCLEIHVNNTEAEIVKMKFVFKYEFSPLPDQEEVYFEADFTIEELNSFIESLEKELEKYPKR